jgi:hypothetical protein
MITVKAEIDRLEKEFLDNEKLLFEEGDHVKIDWPRSEHDGRVGILSQYDRATKSWFVQLDEDGAWVKAIYLEDFFG